MEFGHYSNPRSRSQVVETIRLMPRGLRTMITGHRPLADMPEASLTWMQRREMITTSKRDTWKYTPLGKRVVADLNKKARL